jgi:hypothetical protein
MAVLSSKVNSEITMHMIFDSNQKYRVQNIDVIYFNFPIRIKKGIRATWHVMKTGCSEINYYVKKFVSG